MPELATRRPELASLLQHFADFLESYPSVEQGREMDPVEALFAYRLLLGRNPDMEGELPGIQANAQSRREFLTALLRSREFAQTGGFFPPGQLLMSQHNGFRFWFNTSDREMGVAMALGQYEPSSVAALERLVKPGMTCLDIGAQTGFYTCLLARAVGEAGRVHAFEPMPGNFEILCRNVQENGFGDRTRLYREAASRENGQIEMSAVSNMFVAGQVQGAETFMIECVRLDNVIKDRIDLIKIDVEGHEPAALDGMSSFISSYHPVILTEINAYWLRSASNCTPGDYLDLLQRFGYSVYDIEDTSVPLRTLTLGDLDTINVLALPEA